MKHKKFLMTPMILLVMLSASIVQDDQTELFSTGKSREQFAQEMAVLITKAWKSWQDRVEINDVDVEGSRGMLMPGDISEPVLTSEEILKSFDKVGRSQAGINAAKAVADALEEGMRLWQRGYTHSNIPFPQGASCSYTMPPSNNVPVLVSSGTSPGDSAMTESALYNYMLYRAPDDDEDVLVVFRACAKSIALCFRKWKESCSIVGILASGGIAPQPAPLGTGPGPVSGAKGSGGKLIGPYLDGDLLLDNMLKYLRGHRKSVS
ncbi:MAG: hypothetical protein GF409_06080 [Candidatus Omnitrophica bacterium]|nr:hypothetical protein [Candidatus Omnitrophota bacterium]